MSINVTKVSEFIELSMLAMTVETLNASNLVRSWADAEIMVEDVIYEEAEVLKSSVQILHKLNLLTDDVKEAKIKMLDEAVETYIKYYLTE